MLESELKRQLVKQAIAEGAWGRRIEDKFAVGTLDLLFITPVCTLYAEAKIMEGLRAMPATVAQREQIKRVNEVGNFRARALIIGYRDGHIGFGLPGYEWDKFVEPQPWPNKMLVPFIGYAVGACFDTRQDNASVKAYGR